MHAGDGWERANWVFPGADSVWRRGRRAGACREGRRVGRTFERDWPVVVDSPAVCTVPNRVRAASTSAACVLRPLTIPVDISQRLISPGQSCAPSLAIPVHASQRLLSPGQSLPWAVTNVDDSQGESARAAGGEAGGWQAEQRAQSRGRRIDVLHSHRVIHVPVGSERWHPPQLTRRRQDRRW